jgi:hypothetical protein
MVAVSSKRTLVLIVLTALAVLAVGVAAPLAAASPASHAVPPRLRALGPETSTNWSGYDATGKDNQTPFTSVSATWTVPEVSTAPYNAYSSTWVGLDGDGSNTVEQIGTDSDFINGQPSYYAWYEMYPKMPRNLKLKVSPGDWISASVTATTGKRGASFTLSLTVTDPKTKKSASYTTTQRCPSAQLYSAEAIVEAPWSGGVLPLADFGTVQFTDVAFNEKPISDFNHNAITMVTSDGAPKATPTGLTATSGGDGFSVTWKGY